MVFEKIQKILVEQLGEDASNINKETSFEDLGLDSLDTVEMLMQMEEEFNIEIKAEEIGKTVGELVEYVESRI